MHLTRATFKVWLVNWRDVRPIEKGPHEEGLEEHQLSTSTRVLSPLA